MIIGLGNDIIDIRRMERTIERYGERFLARVFTETERRKSDGRAARAASYAKRFAAKEACAKALGTGFRRGVFWRDMGVVNLPSGLPTLEPPAGPRVSSPTSHPRVTRLALISLSLMTFPWLRPSSSSRRSGFRRAIELFASPSGKGYRGATGPSEIRC